MIPKHYPPLRSLDRKAPGDGAVAEAQEGVVRAEGGLPSGAVPSLLKALARREGGASPTVVVQPSARLGLQRVSIGLSDGERMARALEGVAPALHMRRAALAAEQGASLDLLDAVALCDQVLRDPNADVRRLSNAAAIQGMPSSVCNALHELRADGSAQSRRKGVADLRAHLLELARVAFDRMDRGSVERVFRDLGGGAPPPSPYPVPALNVNGFPRTLMVGHCRRYLKGLSGQSVLETLLHFLDRTPGGAGIASDLRLARKDRDADRCRAIVSALEQALSPGEPLELPSPLSPASPRRGAGGAAPLVPSQGSRLAAGARLAGHDRSDPDPDPRRPADRDR